jgi:hypothetical protein
MRPGIPSLLVLLVLTVAYLVSESVLSRWERG